MSTIMLWHLVATANITVPLLVAAFFTGRLTKH